MQVIPTRMEYFQEMHDKHMPNIKVRDDDGNELDFRNLISTTDKLFFNLRYLADIWNKLLPNEGETIADKQAEIAEMCL